MSSNNTSFFSTLKFRAAFRYFLLFAGSMLLVFFVVFRYLYENTVRGTDRLLELAVSDFSNGYLLGRNAARYGEEIALSRVPPATLEAFRKRFPGVIPLVARRSAGTETQYTVFGHVGGELYEFRLDSGAQPYSRKLDSALNVPFLRGMFADKARAFGSAGCCFRFYAPDGTLLIRSDEEHPFRIGKTQGSGTSTEFEETTPFRVLRVTLYDGSTLEAAHSIAFLEEYLASCTGMILAIFAAVLLLGLAAGYCLARKLTSGIERVSAAARRIAGGDLSQRVELRREGAEVDRMVEAFNMMSESNEHLVTELRTVTDDIAHDLRTPLTRMRGLAEVTISGEQTLQNYREMCGSVAEECDSMMLMINDMLEITRTEAAIDRLNLSDVSLNMLVRQAHELFRDLAEDRKIAFELTLPERELSVRGDKLKLQRLVANLLDNALKFTPEGGRVELSLDERGSRPALVFRDSGCGIPPEEMPNIFKRFYRCDASRTRPGNGLGLAMAQAIARAHHAVLQVESEPGKGSTFTLIFPGPEENSHG